MLAPRPMPRSARPGGYPGNANFWEKPGFKNFASNALMDLGYGLTQGRNFGEGLGVATQRTAELAPQRDAYATAQEEKSDREALLAKAVENLRTKYNAPDIADMVETGGMDLDSAWNEVLQRMKPKEVDHPTSYDEFLLAQKDPAYAAQLAANKGGQTINVGPTGVDYGDPGPGYVWQRDPKTNEITLDERGAPVAIPFQGGKPYMEQQAAAAAGAVKDARTDLKGNVVVQDIDRALTQIAANPGMTTGIGAQLTQGIGGFPAKGVAELLTTVKANAGFAELQAMRESSPTGGALGNITEKEIAYLQATIGSLEQSQEPVQLADNLKRVKNAYLDIIHGPGNGPPRESLSFEQTPAAGQGVAPDVEALVKKYGY